jgi:radical SAM protein with 4Fe4S-binding SPASM domain
MELSIITNGWLAKTPEVTQHLQSLQPECVTVSLDGASAKTHDMIRGVPGSFERVLAAVDHFVELNLPTTVITTVHKMNLKDLAAIRDLLVDKGTAWQVQTATPHGRLEMKHVLSREEYYSVALFIAATRKKYSNDRLKLAGAHDMGYFSRYLENPQVSPWRGCQAGISTLGIQSNGNILGCLALPDEFIEGNIRETPLSEMWYDESLFAYARHVKQSDLGKPCSRCEHRRFCKGGCSAMSNSMTGGLHRDSYCAYAIEDEMGL